MLNQWEFASNLITLKLKVRTMEDLIRQCENPSLQPKAKNIDELVALRDQTY